MVAFARIRGESTTVGGEIVQEILRQRGLCLGELHGWLEPAPLTDDERRAASAARLPSIAELMLIASEEEPME